MLPFLSLVSDAELHRNPTVKAETAASNRPLSALLLTYPVHQAADILGGGGTLVPVGRDQLPHVELTRTIARRFNERYGPIFAEPEALLSSVPLLLGADGEKMSKSRGNTIPLGAGLDEITRTIRSARTDSLRHITFDPLARPEVANLLLLVGCLTGRSPEAVADEIGLRGAGALKALVIEVVDATLGPIRKRRSALIAEPDYLDGTVIDGIAQAGEVAGEVLTRVRQAMGMDYLSAGGRA